MTNHHYHTVGRPRTLALSGADLLKFAVRWKRGSEVGCEQGLDFLLASHRLMHHLIQYECRKPRHLEVVTHVRNFVHVHINALVPEDGLHAFLFTRGGAQSRAWSTPLTDTTTIAAGMFSPRPPSRLGTFRTHPTP